MPTTKVILENIFGMLGIVFWSFQLLPQVVDNYKRKSTEGLSYSMFAIWSLCAIGFGAYSVVQELSIPIIIQPQVFGFLSTLCYLQCLYYGQRTRWSMRKTVVGGILMYIGMAGLEVAAIYGTRVSELTFERQREMGDMGGLVSTAMAIVLKCAHLIQTSMNVVLLQQKNRAEESWWQNIARKQISSFLTCLLVL